MVLPEPAAKRMIHEITEATGKKKRTFAVNPQQGTSHLPLFEFVAFNQPLRSSFMLTITRDVVIC